ncbi:MAG TPA: hypothetical protein V6D35_05760 [Candidatus Sericytochromatia bacterium]|jgi:hypothetical protein
MNLQELETRYRQEIDTLGNQLQNAVLGLSQVETRLLQMGDSIQNLNRIIEEFIQQQQEEE